MQIRTLLLAAALCGASAPTAFAQAKAPSHPTEPFTVWGIRFEPNIEAAVAASKTDGKPVIAYFTFDK
jgi:hypothetical protein